MLKEIQNEIEKWYNGETNFGESCKYYSIAASGNKITITYNPIVKETEEFKDFINKIDDDLFIDVCEKLGSENLIRLNNALKEENENSLKAISEFKSVLKTLIENKLEYYQICWDNLIR